MELKVPGFRWSSVAADVKGKGGGRLDMGLIACDRSAEAAAVFTKNTMAAAPVQLCRKRVSAGRIRAALVNSGNANCMTGEDGFADAVRLSGRVASLLAVPEREVVMCSTGVIGQRLPVERMEMALPGLVGGLAADGLEGFAKSIMTTDTRPKLAQAVADLSGGRVVVVGAAKGAGMIAPDMATMLAFLHTDARLGSVALAACLRSAVAGSFNAITVDGDTSTNDTVLLLSSGAGPSVGSEDDMRAFTAALERACRSLAEQIVTDGEGARHVVEVVVDGARSDGEARSAARAVAESLLVKTAMAAADPNWGRIAGAIGRSGAVTSPGLLSLWIGSVPVVRRGEICPGYDESAAAAVMGQARYSIRVNVGDGPGKASILTCDLTEEYVRINAEYRT